MNICQCAQKTDSFTVTNDGAYSAIFTVSDNQEFVILSDTKFELKPGESKQVLTSINAACDMKGEYSLEILVTTNLGTGKKLIKTINIGKCQNLKAYLTIDDEEINPCKEADYSIKIENTGFFKETYEIKATNFEKYFNLSTEEITLNPDETGLVNAKLNLPCDLYGVQPVEFSIKAVNNALMASLKHDLQVNQYYGYSLLLEDEYHVCEEEPVNIPVVLSNDVNTPNSYSLKLRGQPIIAQLSKTKIELEGKEEETFEIELNIHEGRSVGTYNFQLVTSTGYGDTFNDANITLVIEDCYNHKIDLTGPKKFCSGEEEFNLNIRNDGVYTEEVTLETIEGFAELEDEKITLESGSEKNVVLEVKTEDVSKRYSLWAKAKLDNDLEVVDSQVLNVKSNDECYFVDVEKTKFDVKAHKINGIVIELENKGLVGADYELKLESEPWMHLNETEIHLEPKEEKNVVLFLNHTEETAFGKYKANLTIQTDNAIYLKEIVIDLENKSLIVRAFIYSKENPCKTLTVLLGLVFIILLLKVIFSKKAKGKIKVKTVLLSLLILIILSGLALGGTYLYKGMPTLYSELDFSEANPVKHVWAEDTVYTIDFFDYFEDPDSDEIVFSVSELENIDSSIEGNILTLTPEEDWFGERAVIFTATDSKEASVSSSPIFLKVLDVEEFNFCNIYNKNCLYVNDGLLMLCLLLVFIIVLKKARKVIFGRKKGSKNSKKTNKKKSKKRR